MKRKAIINVILLLSCVSWTLVSSNDELTRNYASNECGSKVIAANPEAEGTYKILIDSRDEYMLNPCKAKIWFVVELCEPIQVKAIELANFELYSSTPKEIVFSGSDKYPTAEWAPLGIFEATESRDLQKFEIQQQPNPQYHKFIRVDLNSFYGSEHFCPVSLIRAFGLSLAEEFDTLENGGPPPIVQQPQIPQQQPVPMVTMPGVLSPLEQQSSGGHVPVIIDNNSVVTPDPMTLTTETSKDSLSGSDPNVGCPAVTPNESSCPPPRVPITPGSVSGSESSTDSTQSSVNTASNSSPSSTDSKDADSSEQQQQPSPSPQSANGEIGAENINGGMQQNQSSNEISINSEIEKKVEDTSPPSTTTTTESPPSSTTTAESATKVDEQTVDAVSMSPTPVMTNVPVVTVISSDISESVSPSSVGAGVVDVTTESPHVVSEVSIASSPTAIYPNNQASPDPGQGISSNVDVTSPENNSLLSSTITTVLDSKIVATVSKITSVIPPAATPLIAPSVIPPLAPVVQGPAHVFNDSNPPPGSVIAASSSKESIFIKLNNRIKALEQNMSLNMMTIEDMRKRQEVLEHRMSEMINRTMDKEVSSNILISDLQNKLSDINEKVYLLVNEKEVFHWQLIQVHIFLMVIEIASIILIMNSFLRKIARKQAEMEERKEMSTTNEDDQPQSSTPIDHQIKENGGLNGLIPQSDDFLHSYNSQSPPFSPPYRSHFYRSLSSRTMLTGHHHHRMTPDRVGLSATGYGSATVLFKKKKKKRRKKKNKENQENDNPLLDVSDVMTFNDGSDRKAEIG